MVHKAILIGGAVAGSVAIIFVVLLAFPQVFIPDRIQVQEGDSINDILGKYQQLVSEIFPDDFEFLKFPEQKAIQDDLELLEQELMDELNNATLTEDPDDPFQLPEPTDPCATGLECEDDPTEFEDPICSAGFSFDELFGGCIIDALADILDPIEGLLDPFAPTATFSLRSFAVLTDSSGNETPEFQTFDIPLQSLIGTGGEILDFGKVSISFNGITEETEKIVVSGALNVLLNDGFITGKQLSGLSINGSGTIPIKIGGGDQFVLNIEDLDSFKSSGLNTLAFDVADFIATTGSTENNTQVFRSMQDQRVFSIDFDFNEGRNTIIDASGQAKTIPIADGSIQLCADSRGQRIDNVETKYIPDTPSSVLVEADGQVIINGFTVSPPDPQIGSGNYAVPTNCEKKTGIPRDTTIVITVNCCNFGTGSANRVSGTESFTVIVPEGGKAFRLDAFVSGITDLDHSWTSNFGNSHARNTPYN